MLTKKIRKSDYTKKIKQLPTQLPKKLHFKGIEFILLVNVLFNQYFQLKLQGIKPEKIKTKILTTLKIIRKNNKLIKSDTTDIDLAHIYKLLSTTANDFLKIGGILEKQSEKQHKYISKEHVTLTSKTAKHNKYVGGFYFKNIEDKGDKPITGSDITRLLDEVQDFIYNLKYTQEGAFLNDVDVLISMLRGDLSQFKSYLTWRIFPKFYQVTPPFIKWSGFQDALDTKKYEDIPDYLFAYQKYLRSRDEYLVEKGEKSPNVLKRGLYTGFYDKLAKSLDTNILAYQKLQRERNLNFYPISLPV